jgi:leader peptidase (prepilin peptidase)/N-methyltransferase
LGSFANVAALRSLSGEDWVSQPSACFNCGARLSGLQNLPLFGYLHHGGKAACCGAVLPSRYIFVELAMAGLCVAAVRFLPLAVALVYLPFILLMLVIFLTDLDDFIIPDWASLGGTALGLFTNLFAVPALPSMLMALAGGAAGFALIYGINFLYKLVRGHDGLGFGDVKLMMCFGVWLGPVCLLPILFSASIMGAIFGIGAILSARWQKRDDAPVQLPFGCFLAPMAIAWLFFAPHALRGF